MIRDLADSLTCVLVDDHPVITEALAEFLATKKVGVVGKAYDLASGRAIIRDTQPTVAIVDLRLGTDDGLELVRILPGISARTSAVVYTALTDASSVRQALELGVRGIVIKSAPLDDLVRAVVAVAHGGSFVDPSISAAVIGTRDNGSPDGLTFRQRQVVRLLAEGLQDASIAEQLMISIETVRAHVKHAMAGLQARTRSQLISTAHRRGIID